jgi:predicted phosphate transport protein (TIGR00153 family)
MNIRNFFKELFGDRGREIEVGLDEYLHKLNGIASDMHGAIRAYLNQDTEEFSHLFGKINEFENQLDTLRRNIEAEIYGKRLLPDTRDDVLELLENLDKIPNRIQSTIREMTLQNIRIPEGLHSSLTELAGRNVQIVQVLIRVINAFLYRPHDVRDGVKELSHHEHEGDVIEQQVLKLIFDDASLELAEKMQLYRFGERVGSICDMAEDLGDHIMIWAIKRLL